MNQVTEASKELQQAYHAAEYFYELQNYRRAEEAFRDILTKEPGMLAAALSLAGSLRMQGRRPEAIAEYVRILEDLHPNDPHALSNVGATLFEQDRPDEAIRACESALRHAGGDPAVISATCVTMWGMLHKDGNLEAAIRYIKKAIKSNPDWHIPHNNLGATYLTQGRFLEARECFDKAIELQGGFVSAHVNRAMTSFHLGKWEEAIEEHEWRLRQQVGDVNVIKRINSLEKPYWSGQDLKGKTILVYCEQGLGDTVFFARYLTALRHLGPRKIIFETQWDLYRMMKKMADEVIPWRREVRAIDFDYHCSVVSLPYAIQKAGIQTNHYYPHHYLMRDNPARHGMIKIGIAWKGNPKFPEDQHRSASLMDFVPLILRFGTHVKFTALQQGVGRYDAIKHHVNIASPRFADFAETRDAMESMDLIITTDTAIPHVAGAMGKEVWLLKNNLPEWRWGESGNRTAWYPTVKIYRRTGDWSTTFDKLAEDLDAELS